ncbi:hypothetical protein NDI76_13120 [Halogeometricum sp. S1BR25-6]|uniref:Halobacterial output domain-containing protein n=1 Tax=Halogeometricum salsisoli TaxID=2950536 RepID=A0ABU2GHD2_9EURY|nr:HalOD1 output domain-containing protein [Halogeometricum sp. S1BR25-6]MDS0299683.1 hypothetical protein [Halogeometricum sp. S1BR25-6]
MSADTGDGNGSSIPFRTIDDFRYDEQMGMHRARYDAESAHELLVDIVLAVADIEGATTDGIDPAYRTIDGDAFETLVRASVSEDVSAGPLTFPLGGCRVTVVAGEVTFERRSS